MHIDTEQILPLLIKVTGDEQAEIFSKVVYSRLEVTMYWNQLNNRYALQKSIAQDAIYSNEETIGYAIEQMLKEIEYEVGRIYYES